MTRAMPSHLATGPNAKSLLLRLCARIGYTPPLPLQNV